LLQLSWNLKYSKLETLSQDPLKDEVKPQYPEVAKIKNGNIIVEPYLANKYI